MSNKVLIAVIVIIILVGGGFLLFSRNYTATPRPVPSQNTQTFSTPTTNTQQATSPTQAQQGQNTIIYTSSGFSPASLTIKAEITVTWINNSGSDLSVNSNPHPIHTNYSPLNIGAIGDRQSKSLIFDKPGTYGYHNHLNPSQTGTIVVQ